MAGGLRERLRTAALRPIRRWLRVGTDAELDVRWIGLAGLELRLGAAELNAEAIGREALHSAPVALRRATVRGARVAVSLVGAPAVVLVVEGLHIEIIELLLTVSNSRPVDDDYWKEVMLERKEQERINKLAAIDPEGAAEHSRAEKQANKDQTNGFWARLLASFLLSAVRLELHDAKIILQSVSQDHQASLSAKDLIVREGSGQSIFKGSLIGTAANFAVNARKNTISTKPCSVSQLSLRFETHVMESRTGNLQTGGGGHSQPSVVNREHDQHVVLVVMLLLSCRFHRELFTDLEVHIPEAVFGLHSGELDALMKMLAELQGPPIRHIPNPGCIGQHLTGRRSAKELWTRAIAKAIGISPRYRLSRTLQAGFLRRRYASLYGDWLQKIGWRRKENVIVRSDSLQRLSASVAEIEKQLPVEAVALARLISRRHRLAMLLSEPAENNHQIENGNSGLNVFLRKMRSLLPFRRTGHEDAADMEEPAKAQESGTRRWVETFSLNISRGSVIFAAYNDNAESGGGVAVCIRWKKASIAYGSRAHVLGYSCVCGSLLAEVISLATQDSETFLEQRGSECRGRWEDKVVDRFVFFSSSALQSSQGSSNGKIMKSYSTHAQMTHVALKDQETGKWVRKPWKCLDEQVEVQESLDSLQAPFLVVVYENPLGGSIGEPQESCSSMLAVGKADFVFKCSLFSQVFPLLSQLKKFQDAGSPSTKSRSVANSSKLDVVYKEHISLCLKSLRNLAFSIVPDKCLQFSAAIEDVRMIFLASDAELPGQKLDSSTMPTLILDLGYLEFAIWPATSKAVGPEADPASIKKLETQPAALFDKKEWIRRPPLPTLPALDRYLEHDQFGNNFILCIEGVSVTSQRRNAVTENLVEPFTITFESSFCRDHFSSLFDSFKSVSVAAVLTVPTFIIDLRFDKTQSLLQVAFCYINAAMGLISNFSETSESPGNSEGGTQKSNSEESGVKSFALCLNVALGNFKVHVGNSDYGEKNQHAGSFKENGQDGMRAGLFTVESLWFYCTLGDGLCVSICSGLQKIQLCLVDIKMMKQFKLKLSDLEQFPGDRHLQDSTTSRSRKLVNDKLFADHLIVTFSGPAAEIGATDGNENHTTSFIHHENESDKPCSDIHGNFYCSIEVDLGTVLVAGCPLENLMTRARQCSSTAENMRILLAVEKDVQKCVLEIQGGLLVFHTTALAGIINFVAKYAEYSTELLVLLKSSEGDPIVKEERQDTFTRLDRSYSLPEGRQFDKHGLAPFRSQSNPQQILESNDELFAEGVLSSKLSGFSLVVATAGDSPGKPVEGVLLEVTATFSMEAQRSSCKIIADVNQFTVISLQSQLNPDSNGTPTNRIPQFGFLHTEAESSGGVKEISSTDSKGTSSTGDNAATEVPRLDYIVECLAVSSSLSRRSRRDMDLSCNNYWQGHISVTGFDVALTTYEVQTLLSIVTPLANISFASGSKTKETYTNSAHTIERGLSAGIPDGSIVAIKDAQEHLYLSVEVNPTSKDQYHLAGVWHYSVASERALFKVKYHAGNKGEDRSAWFSLSSLHAKNSAGVPLRVHYRPGSRQVEISSTNDGSWELWQCIPYRSSADDAAGELDVYSGIFSNLVHLINQKSKQGLAFVDGIPTVVSRPGNPFKVKVVGQPAQVHSFLGRDTLSKNQTNRTELSAAPSVPEVRCDIGSIYVTLLHEAAGAVHLLPLIRMRLEEVQGLAQVSSRKTRIIAGCSLVLEHFEAQSSSWLSIVNPVVADIVCSSRTEKPADGYRKIPTSLFCKLKKVDFVVSELSLDACLFLIGVMDLAGPYTIKYSPVLVNRCKIENQTGVNLFCRFDREGGGQEEGKIPAWQSNSYLMRHVTSRRGTTPAEVSTSVAISLEKPGKGLSSAVNIFLRDPGVLAVRTRLEAFEGSRVNAPGPIVVLDVSRQSQDGIYLTVSPMVKIHNATGLALQLRCRRPKQSEEGGAIVSLKDGDIIDDSMGAFDALRLEGEMKKALLSFNVGNFLLSIRPENFESQKGVTYDWSEDVKGAKAVRVSGLFEKLHYSFKRTLKSKSLESSFGSVLCKASLGAESENESASGLHFLIRTVRRQVPVTRLTNDNQQNRSLVAWQEQQELVLLPTLRVFNFLSTAVHVQVTTAPGGKDKRMQGANEVTISGRGGKASLYADLSALFLVIKDDQGLVSTPVDISTGHKRFQELAKKGGSIKDLDIEITFNDGLHVAILKVYRADDGVMELVIFTKYVLQNDSQVPIICCAAKGSSRWQGRRSQNLQWPPSARTISLDPSSPISWFHKSNNLLMKRNEEGAYPAALDLDSLSGSVEISLGVESISSVDKIQLGVRFQAPSQADSDPSHFVRFSPRYTVVNESAQSICVCQDGFEDDEDKAVVVAPGAQAAVHAQILEGRDENFHAGAEDTGKDTSALTLRFRLRKTGWRWSGHVCAASLGSFFLKLRRESASDEFHSDGGVEQAKMQFAVLHVEEEAASLIMHFRLHSREAVPYRIENRLHSGSITFHQKGMTEPETLLPNSSMDYVWDDLSLPHRLVVTLAGTQAASEVNIDKIKAWKSFAAAHRNKGFSLQLPFQGQLGIIGLNDRDQSDDLLDTGYEVYADGQTRVLRVCQKVDSTKKNYWQSEMSIPQLKVELKVPIFRIHIVETPKQKIEDLTGEELAGNSSPFTPFLCAVLTSLSTDIIVTSEYTFCQSRIQSLGVDIKWQGAPFSAMLRVHDQDRLNKTTTVLHAAFVLSNTAANPIQVKYSSLLLQAFDLNIDEDTLMKLVPFNRTSLATTSSSRQIYFERFEIHPIKIVASFVPGRPRADYTSAQETFRGLLHTVIKLPSVRGATVELNGVLLSHALLTFRQLVMKCVQHYSWYAMRAIYIARGSKLLPPGFASLFDDSAASSLDVFFDPSSGSIDLQGLTLGMFNLLSRGLRKKGQGGTSRYLGDLEKTVKKAGSNLVFAVVTEISDNVLKGAETNGFDGMVNGFRRGILNFAMEPSVLQKAVVRGGSTRRIQLDRSVGTDEAYIEGYLQATLDALFKQDYLKVKVMEDQVILKNLPPNSMLMNDIITCVKNFLIGEGLLAGEASLAAVRSMRLLRREQERKLVPAVISLSEQLLVIFIVRGLRQYTRKIFHMQGPYSKTEMAASVNKETTELAPVPPPSQPQRPSFKRTVGNFCVSSLVAYLDGRLCRHIPNEFARRIVSGFLLSFVE